MPGLTNRPPRGRGSGRITSVGGRRTRCEVDILNFLVRIHRPGESGSTKEVLVVLSHKPTIHGTISRFHNSLANFWLSFAYAIFSGRDNRCVSLGQVQTSKQDNHVVHRKFAFNRQFVRGSVGTPEGISSISGNHWIQCRVPLLWILDPESIPSISRNHWIHCLTPFILDLGPSRASDCELLCYSNHPFG